MPGATAYQLVRPLLLHRPSWESKSDELPGNGYFRHADVLSIFGRFFFFSANRSRTSSTYVDMHLIREFLSSDKLLAHPQLDGTPSLNLASFVTTYMDTHAEKLMAEHAATNFIDYEE
jgi:exonuclease I